MENPVLRLVVEKGPKEGEMLECKPGAHTRIGRVVKGNTFAIRDPGISQKHLAFEFLCETSRWVVSDLDTSNGTLVNDANIRPSVPFPLSDGDSIKIGEMTSISVRIAGGEPHIDAAAAEEEEEERTGVRRRRRRRGAPPARPEGERPSDATVDVGSEAPARNGGRGRGRSKKTAASATVPKKDDILDAVVVESAEAPKNAGKGRERRRPTTRAASARVSKEDEEDEEVKRSGSVPVSNSESVEAAAKGDFLRLEASNAGQGAKLAESGAGEARQVEGEENMDKMTLGEWFDQMEKSLPLMINDISEEIISSLREKARQFDDFVAQSVHAS